MIANLTLIEWTVKPSVCIASHTSVGVNNRKVGRWERIDLLEWYDGSCPQSTHPERVSESWNKNMNFIILETGFQLLFFEVVQVFIFVFLGHVQRVFSQFLVNTDLNAERQCGVIIGQVSGKSEWESRYIFIFVNVRIPHHPHLNVKYNGVRFG